MVIGTFGDIIFETSDKRFLTPTSMTRSGAAVWADHPLLYAKPKREFMHSEPRKVDMEIVLKADLGVKPRETLKLLYKHMENGWTYHLIIAGKTVTRYKMAIMSISDAWDIVLSEGELFKATVSVSFEEAK